MASTQMTSEQNHMFDRSGIATLSDMLRSSDGPYGFNGPPGVPRGKYSLQGEALRRPFGRHRLGIRYGSGVLCLFGLVVRLHAARSP